MQRRRGRSRWRGRLALAAPLVLVLAAVVWRGPLAAHGRTLLLLTQELPQSPVRPLQALTDAPRETQVRLDSPAGPVVADLYVPAPGGAPGRGAVVMALGVALAEADRPAIRGFSRTLARLGYVVLWPRSAALDAQAVGPESPETFVAAVEYLRGLEGVDGERISLLGFSVGASTALVAAGSPPLEGRVRSLVSFGGYHDLAEYLVSVASRSVVVDGREEPWEPHPETVRRVREVPAALGAGGVLAVLDATTRAEAQARLRAVPAEERAALDRLNPAAHLHRVRARVFVLHDRGDFFVPYAESVRLRRSLPQAQLGAFLLTDLFQHAQPKSGVSWAVARDVVSLYGFVVDALETF